MRHILVLLGAIGVAGCQTGYDSLAYGPSLTPVGHGMQPAREALPVTFAQAPQKTFRSTYNMNSQSMYRDLRASQVGDVLTVTIEMDDKAEFDNQTDRSRNASSGFGFDTGLNLSGSDAAPMRARPPAIWTSPMTRPPRARAPSTGRRSCASMWRLWSRKCCQRQPAHQRLAGDAGEL